MTGIPGSVSNSNSILFGLLPSILLWYPYRKYTSIPIKRNFVEMRKRVRITRCEPIPASFRTVSLIKFPVMSAFFPLSTKYLHAMRVGFGRWRGTRTRGKGGRWPLFRGPCIRQKLFNLMKPLLESVLLNRTVTYLLPSNLQIAHKRMNEALLRASG